MPIEIQDLDEGMGNIIVTRGMVTDRELIDYLKPHLTHETDRFINYRYILMDHTDLTKLDISDDTVESIAGLIADISSDHPDIIAAMVAYVTVGANIELVGRISKLHELFIYPSNWETMIFRTRGKAVRWIKVKARDNFGIDDLTFD